MSDGFDDPERMVVAIKSPNFSHARYVNGYQQVNVAIFHKAEDSQPELAYLGRASAVEPVLRELRGVAPRGVTEGI